MAAVAFIDRRLFQIRYSACMVEMRQAPALRYTNRGPIVGCYEGVCPDQATLDDYGQIHMEYAAYEPAAAALAFSFLSAPTTQSARITLRYRDTEFFVEDTRSPLDGGDLQFWDIYAVRCRYSETADAWFVRVTVDVPRREVQIIRRYEYHTGGYLADETYERILTASLRLLTRVPRAYLSRGAPGNHGFRLCADPLEPVKASEGPGLLQWIQDRTSAATAAQAATATPS